ncbi:MAG: serine/threonine-protein kinase [Bacteroidia bacterium]|nr:serine/threonine-protein kinase [Bacteroidia bacterium]
MDQQKWQKIQEAFDYCLSLKQNQREEYLKTIYHDDQEMYKELLRLIENVDPASEFFERLEENVSTAFQSKVPPNHLSGLKLGPFLVMDEIGRGGMAYVYRAKRVEGDFEQEVAIKFVKEDPWSDHLKFKFQEERQILAQLKHPHIAQIYDGGETDQQLSYLIMEFVEGQNIVEFVQSHDLGIEERISIFLKIVDALSFAHSKLIIHRDLKPSNILIDAKGEPKLLDFGIASLLDHESETSDQHRLWAFTPEYASPEQVMGKSLGTASDIYQLGLLLYEIITGVRAFHFANNNLSENQKLVMEQVPKTPSEHIQDRARRKKVEGDLDQIVMKCIQKVPEGRYQQLQVLIQDLKAFLANGVISLRSEDWKYRSWKFMQRNWLSVSLIALSMLILTVGIVLTQKETKRTRAALKKERLALAKARASSDFLKSIFLEKDPYKTDPQKGSYAKLPSRTIEEILDESIPRFISNYKLDPVLNQELMFLASSYYGKLGNYEKASFVLEQIAHFCDSSGLCSQLDKLELARQYGLAKYSLGKPRAADSAFRLALKWAEFLPASAEVEAIQSLTLMDYAEFRSAMGHIQFADSLFEESFKLYNKQVDSLLGQSSGDGVFRILLSWSRVKGNLGKYKEAIDLADSALSLSRALFGHESYSNVEILYQLGQNYMYLQKWDSARTKLEEGILLYEKADKEPDWLITALKNDLANVYGGEGAFQAQDSLLELTLALKKTVFGKGHIYNAPTWLAMGHAKMFLKQYKEAESAYQTALSINQRNLPQGHQNIAASYLALARLYSTLKSYKKAEAQANKGLNVSKTLPKDHRVVAFGQLFLGQALFMQGKYTKAKEVLLQSLASMKKLGLKDNIREIEAMLDEMKK